MFGRETGGSNCLGNSLVLFLIMSSIATAINTKTPVLMSIVATMEFFLHMVGLHGRQISYLAAVWAVEKVEPMFLQPCGPQLPNMER